MNVPPLTIEQALIVMGYTGFACAPFDLFHKDVEKRIGHPVWSHQFGDEDFTLKVQDMYKDDFLSICVKDTP